MQDRNAILNTVLQFIQKKHLGQNYALNVPKWHHLARVSKRLELLLETNDEGTTEDKTLIIISALGHDILEDTKTTKEGIVKIFGKDGYELIFELTNEWGDKNVAPYVEKISRASEEARLIKLSDLYDNFTSVTYTLPALGKEWATYYFLPIAIPMNESIQKTLFRKYTKTASHFKAAINYSVALLQNELENFGL